MTYIIPQHSIFKLPFYVQTDANDRTAKTAISLSAIAIYTKKNEQGIAAAVGNSGLAETNQGFGLYTAELVAADTDTVGPMVIVIAATGGFVHLIEVQVVPNPYATVCEPLAGTAGVVKVSTLPDSDAANHWAGSILRIIDGALKGQQRKITASAEMWPLINGATYDDADNVGGEHLLYSPGSFAAYTWASGDKVRIRSGTNMTPGTYTIASKVSDDAILLSTSAGSDNGVGDIVVESMTSLTLLGGLTSAPVSGVHAVLIAE